MSINLVIALIALHWFADFFCQTDKMAINKSSSNFWLTLHVIVYTTIIWVLGYWLFNMTAVNIFSWSVVNGILHWVTDFITSRINSRLWKNNQRHWFFTMIGVDQMIHYTCLLYTYQMVAQ